ncbi:MAG: hypothetical protein Q9170_002024 [Blastenia crenularia]
MSTTFTNLPPGVPYTVDIAIPEIAIGYLTNYNTKTFSLSNEEICMIAFCKKYNRENKDIVKALGYSHCLSWPVLAGNPPKLRWAPGHLREVSTEFLDPVLAELKDSALEKFLAEGHAGIINPNEVNQESNFATRLFHYAELVYGEYLRKQKQTFASMKDLIPLYEVKGGKAEDADMATSSEARRIQAAAQKKNADAAQVARETAERNAEAIESDAPHLNPVTKVQKGGSSKNPKGGSSKGSSSKGSSSKTKK